MQQISLIKNHQTSKDRRGDTKPSQYDSRVTRDVKTQLLQ